MKTILVVSTALFIVVFRILPPEPGLSALAYYSGLLLNIINASITSLIGNLRNRLKKLFVIITTEVLPVAKTTFAALLILSLFLQKFRLPALRYLP